MGRITPELLGLLGIPWERFPENDGQTAAVLERAAGHFRACSTPYALVMPHGAVVKRPLAATAHPALPAAAAVAGQPTPQGHDPDDVLRLIQQAAGQEDVLVTTTGYTSRSLYGLADKENQLYIVGSMGCASSVALGLALARPGQRILVVDGDGAVLMRPSSMAAVGAQRPANLVHILLNNGVHESTGAQATLAANVDFRALAAACGYPVAVNIGELAELQAVLDRRQAGLQFLHVRTRPRTRFDLPRPAITPAQTAQRMRKWMAAHDHAQLAAAAS